MLLIVSPNYKGETPLLIKTAQTLGWEVYSDGWRIPKHLLNTPGAVYGELLFCETIAEQMNWKLISNPFDWITKLPEEYVNRKVEFMTLAEARNITEEKFIKPADIDCFDAKIYASGKDLPSRSTLDNVPTLVSDVMKFTSEYRCFVKNRSVISACCYWFKKFGMTEAAVNKSENYLNNNEVIIEFVNKMLKDERVECAPSAVIDVGRFKKDTYTVIKTNPAWTSGIYGCEMVAALDAIKSACVSNQEN
jgi:hypothetical protein